MKALKYVLLAALILCVAFAAALTASAAGPTAPVEISGSYTWKNVKEGDILTFTVAKTGEYALYDDPAVSVCCESLPGEEIDPEDYDSIILVSWPSQGTTLEAGIVYTFELYYIDSQTGVDLTICEYVKSDFSEKLPLTLGTQKELAINFSAEQPGYYNVNADNLSGISITFYMLNSADNPSGWTYTIDASTPMIFLMRGDYAARVTNVSNKPVSGNLRLSLRNNEIPDKSKLETFELGTKKEVEIGAGEIRYFLCPPGDRYSNDYAYLKVLDSAESIYPFYIYAIIVDDNWRDWTSYSQYCSVTNINSGMFFGRFDEEKTALICIAWQDPTNAGKMHLQMSTSITNSMYDRDAYNSTLILPGQPLDLNLQPGETVFVKLPYRINEGDYFESISDLDLYCIMFDYFDDDQSIALHSTGELIDNGGAEQNFKICPIPELGMVAKISCMDPSASGPVRLQLTADFPKKTETSGKLTETIQWTLDKATGTLSITGTGKIPNYEDYSLDKTELEDVSPFARDDRIKSVVFGPGITSISKYLFHFCINLKDVTLSSTIKDIRKDAFLKCYALEKIILTKNVEKIHMDAFEYCYALKSVSIRNENATIESIMPWVWHLEDFVIYGYAGSTAEKFAKKHSLTFIPITVENTAAHKHTLQNYLTAATVGKAGKLRKICNVCGETISTTPIAAIKSVALAKTAYSYDGAAKTPTVTVLDANKKALKNGKDFTVKYSSGRKKIGAYAVKITFCGKYTGTKKLTFNIVPGKVANLRVTVKNRTASLAWNAVKGATQYIVYYKKGSGAYQKLGTTKKTTASMVKLAGGATYTYAVRAVCVTGGKTYQGALSAAKSVKVK